MGSDEAFVTLVTNDSYGLGALVLGHSLRHAGTSRQLAILITPGVTESMRKQLSSIYDLVQLVDVLDSQDAANLALLARPELGITLTKIHAWNLTQYKKAVFLDADCLVIQNVDDLFNREELSAVPDVGWPDCFNTGVFVFRPNVQTYEALIKFALEKGSFDGGDQGLLNSFFHDWATKDIATHLPFIYNMVATVIYSYAPAFKQFGKNVKIVHFLGSTKPWHHSTASSSAALGEFLQQWWCIFNSHVRGQLEPGLAGLAGSIASMNLGSDFGSQVSSAAYRQASHRRDWEAGNIDYMGADSYENIQRRIQESIGAGPVTAAQSAKAKSPTPPPTTGQQGHAAHAQSAKQPTPPPQAAKQPTPPPQATKQPTPPPQSQPAHPHPTTAKQPSPPPQSQAAHPATKQPSPPPEATKQPTPPPQSQPAHSATAKQPSPPVQTHPTQAPHPSQPTAHQTQPAAHPHPTPAAAHPSQPEPKKPSLPPQTQPTAAVPKAAAPPAQAPGTAAAPRPSTTAPHAAQTRPTQQPPKK